MYFYPHIPYTYYTVGLEEVLWIKLRNCQVLVSIDLSNFTNFETSSYKDGFTPMDFVYTPLRFEFDAISRDRLNFRQIASDRIRPLQRSP